MSQELLRHRFVGTRAEVGSQDFTDIGQVMDVAADDLYQLVVVGKAAFVPESVFESLNFDEAELRAYRTDCYFGPLPEHYLVKVEEAGAAFTLYRDSLMAEFVATQNAQLRLPLAN